mmetsp:Transcript_11210/g.48457  ORF Transcript_11210/g.48457 Transcript_11210/m.48457 type:complete len:283 (+) Transcript_11210:1409-2257(+)
MAPRRVRNPAPAVGGPPPEGQGAVPAAVPRGARRHRRRRGAQASRRHPSGDRPARRRRPAGEQGTAGEQGIGNESARGRARGRRGPGLAAGHAGNQRIPAGALPGARPPARVRRASPEAVRRRVRRGVRRVRGQGGEPRGFGFVPRRRRVSIERLRAPRDALAVRADAGADGAGRGDDGVAPRARGRLGAGRVRRDRGRVERGWAVPGAEADVRPGAAAVAGPGPGRAPGGFFRGRSFRRWTAGGARGAHPRRAPAAVPRAARRRGPDTAVRAEAAGGRAGG